MAPRLVAKDIRELLPMRRAPGNHVSHIINQLCVRLGKFEERGDGPVSQIQFEMGSAAEQAIADGLIKRYSMNDMQRYIHGVELERDGITGNCDLFDSLDFVVEEVKLTKISIRNEIDGDRFWHYWQQLKNYCYMIGALTGRLHIIFVNGNYKFPGDRGWSPELSGWQYRCWEDTWTKKELADAWRMTSGHRLTG